MDRIYYNKFNRDKIGSSQEDITYKQLDCKVLKKILNDYFSLISKYNILEKGLINEFLYDIDGAIMASKFTEVQTKRMFLWFSGYNEREIAEAEGVSVYVIHKSIVAACNKVLAELQRSALL